MAVVGLLGLRPKRSSGAVLSGGGAGKSDHVPATSGIEAWGFDDEEAEVLYEEPVDLCGPGHFGQAWGESGCPVGPEWRG